MPVIDEEEYKAMYRAARENFDVLSDLVDGGLEEEEAGENVYKLIDAGIAFRRSDEDYEHYLRVNKLGEDAHQFLEEGKTEDEFAEDMMEAEEDFEESY